MRVFAGLCFGVILALLLVHVMTADGFNAAMDRFKDWQILWAALLASLTAFVTIFIFARTRAREEEVVKNQASAIATEIRLLTIELYGAAVLLRNDQYGPAILRLRSLPNSVFFTRENAQLSQLPQAFMASVIEYYFQVDDLVDRYLAEGITADEDWANRVMVRVEAIVGSANAVISGAHRLDPALRESIGHVQVQAVAPT